MKNVKSAVLGISIALMSVFGAVSTANAAVPTSSEQQAYQDGKSNNIPESYHKYGFGEVKADGQWVNDN